MIKGEVELSDFQQKLDHALFNVIKEGSVMFTKSKAEKFRDNDDLEDIILVIDSVSYNITKQKVSFS
jgi:hypothetical protein